jgi:hypothetical protein
MKTIKITLILIVISLPLKGIDTLRYSEITNVLGSFFPKFSYENTFPTVSTVDSIANYFSSIVCPTYSGKLQLVLDTLELYKGKKYVCEYQEGKMVKMIYQVNPSIFWEFDFVNGFPFTIKSDKGDIRIQRDSLNRIIDLEVLYRDPFINE